MFVALSLYSSCVRLRVPLAGDAGTGVVCYLVNTFKKIVTCTLH